VLVHESFDPRPNDGVEELQGKKFGETFFFRNNLLTQIEETQRKQIGFNGIQGDGVQVQFLEYHGISKNKNFSSQNHKQVSSNTSHHHTCWI